MVRKNDSIILISVLFAVCSLAFQNCSSFQTIVLLNAPLAQAQSDKNNPIDEMMNYSEQQIKDTRQKLEKRSNLFGEERLENLKVGGQKRQIAADEQSVPPVYDEDLTIEEITSQKQIEKPKEGK